MKSLRYGLLAIGLSTQLGCAHARQAGINDAVTQESNAMSANRDKQIHTLQEYPELTPEGMGRRFLSYLDSLHSKEQLTPEFLEQKMGVKFLRWSDGGKNGAGFTMTLPDRHYGVGYYNPQNRSTAPSDGKSVTLAFASTSFQGDEGMTPVCAMDFDAYRAELEKIGYKDMKVADYDHGARLPVYYFARGNVVVTIDVLGESELNPHHLCVRNIDVSVGG